MASRASVEEQLVRVLSDDPSLIPRAVQLARELEAEGTPPVLIPRMILRDLVPPKKGPRGGPPVGRTQSTFTSAEERRAEASKHDPMQDQWLTANNPIQALLGVERSPVLVHGPTWPGTLNYWDVTDDEGEATVPAWDLYTDKGMRWLEVAPRKKNPDERTERLRRAAEVGGPEEAMAYYRELWRRHQDVHFQVKNDTDGRVWNVVIQHPSNKNDYAKKAPASLLNDPLVLLWDATYAGSPFFDPLGQRMPGYYASTLLENAQRGSRSRLVPFDYQPNWGIFGEGYKELIRVLRGVVGGSKQNPPPRAGGVGVHLIQRRPRACVVLLDLKAVDSYAPGDQENHGLRPLLCGWGVVHGEARIARKGLDGMLHAELAHPGPHQHSTQLVRLAARLGIDLLQLEDALCWEGEEWHKEKGFDPHEFMMLMNPGDEHMRELERRAAGGDYEAQAKLDAVRRRSGLLLDDQLKAARQQIENAPRRVVLPHVTTWRELFEDELPWHVSHEIRLPVELHGTSYAQAKSWINANRSSLGIPEALNGDKGSVGVTHDQTEASVTFESKPPKDWAFQWPIQDYETSRRGRSRLVRGTVQIGPFCSVSSMRSIDVGSMYVKPTKATISAITENTIGVLRDSISYQVIIRGEQEPRTALVQASHSAILGGVWLAIIPALEVPGYA